jgi:hypothetical protein
MVLSGEWGFLRNRNRAVTKGQGEEGPSEKGCACSRKVQSSYLPQNSKSEVELPSASECRIAPHATAEQDRCGDLIAPTALSIWLVRLLGLSAQAVVFCTFGAWKAHSRRIPPRLNIASEGGPEKLAESDKTTSCSAAHASFTGAGFVMLLGWPSLIGIGSAM